MRGGRRLEPVTASPRGGTVRVGPPAPPPSLPSRSTAGSARSVMAGATRLAPLARPWRRVVDGTGGDGSTGPPVFLNDAERMLLVSCMDVDPYASCQTLAPSAVPTWLAPHDDRERDDGSQPSALVSRGSGSSMGGGSPKPPGSGRVVSMGRLAASKSAVFVSLMGIHMLVRHLPSAITLVTSRSFVLTCLVTPLRPTHHIVARSAAACRPWVWC